MMKKNNRVILHVINVRWFNATAWYALRLAYLQQRAGYTVYIITIPDTDTFLQAKNLGIPVLPLSLNSKNPFTRLRSFFAMRSLLKQYSIDVVHCHRGESCILWGLWRLLYPFLFIRTRGDQRPPKKNFFNFLLHKYLFDGIIVTNSAMYSVIQKNFSLPEQKLALIIGGVDTKAFAFSEQGRKDIRSLYGFSEKDCVFGILGRLDWVKGQREFLYALQRFLTDFPNVPIKLLLLGFSSGIQEHTFHTLIQQLNLEQYVTITGRCSKLTDYLSALDVGLLTSLGSETISRAASELLVMQRPLLATNVGVMPDILPHNMLITLPKHYTEPSFVSLYKKESSCEQALFVDNEYILCFYNALKRYCFDAQFQENLKKTCTLAAKKLDENDFFQQVENFYAQCLQSLRTTG